MTENRELTKEEKELNNKSITRMLHQSQEATDYIEILQFKIDKEIPYNYKTSIDNYNKQIKDSQRTITTNTEMINVLTKQNTEGVPPKENEDKQ